MNFKQLCNNDIVYRISIFPEKTNYREYIVIGRFKDWKNTADPDSIIMEISVYDKRIQYFKMKRADLSVCTTIMEYQELKGTDYLTTDHDQFLSWLGLCTCDISPYIDKVNQILLEKQLHDKNI